MARLRVGVIGAGMIAQLAHIGTLARLEDAEIAAIADPRAALLDRVADRHGIARRFSDHRALLEEPDLDAIVVAVARRAQSSVLSDSINRGLPVLVEKPVAYTSEIAFNLARRARERGTSVQVGYMRRHDPAYPLFRDSVAGACADGSLGDLLQVSVRDFCGVYGVAIPAHVRNPGSPMDRYAEHSSLPAFVDEELRRAYDASVNVALHDLNMLRGVFGDGLRALSMDAAPGRGQTLLVDCGPCTATAIIAPADLGVWDQEIEAIFRKGSITLRLESPLELQGTGSVRFRYPDGERVVRPPYAERTWAFTRQMSSFLASTREAGEASPDLDEAARDVALVEDLWRRRISKNTADE